jgi:hypothetical protein
MIRLGYPTQNLSLPTWEVRGARPKLHLSSQGVGEEARRARLPRGPPGLALPPLRPRMVEAKGKELALVPLGARIG